VGVALGACAVLGACAKQPEARQAQAAPSLQAPMPAPAPPAPSMPPVEHPGAPSAPSAADSRSADAGAPPSAADSPGVAVSPQRTIEELLAMPGTASTSLGGPSSGTLVGAVALPQAGPGFVHNARRPVEARYASVELVQAIVRAAAVIDQELPGSVLVVNDLSLASGGPIAQHGSHQSGRDADILFYSLDAKGKPLPSVGVPLDPEGKGWDFKDLTTAADDQRVRLDARRTFRFVRALLEAAPQAVQRIFVVEHVRTLLLAEAARVRAPRAIVRRFDEITCQPESPHDDHLHVRFFCSPEDLGLGCEDSPPIYPWRNRALAALGVNEVLASAYTTPVERRAKKQRTSSPAQARKRAGQMHPRVTAFLDAREAWLPRPHPGRPYCR
jgi:penicillin-insensitive murein DD-endopeptidase